MISEKLEFKLNIRGQLQLIEEPWVMAIINATPNSFYDGGKNIELTHAMQSVEQAVKDGAKIIDIGGCSTKPGSKPPSVQEEINRTIPIIKEVRTQFPEVFISIDTYRAAVAKEALNAGADMINDISAGNLDSNLLKVVVEASVPYFLMHMQGEPETMQQNPSYMDVTQEVIYFLSQKISVLRELGINDIIIDPGFGFGKTVSQNFMLLKNIEQFKIFELPILAGLSRKSLICKTLSVEPSAALNGTTALNMAALLNGASILRVHDVKEAVECVKLFKALKQ
jgi:dihydropteroate synthase